MKSKQMALCGLLCALAVVCMVLASAIGIGTFIGPILAMTMLLPILEEYGAKIMAVSYVATAPKSNAACNAIFEALDKVKETGNLPVPTHLQDAHYKGSAKLGHGIGYKYAHDYKNHYVKQQYLPYELTGSEFYRPTGNGYEVKIREHMKRIKSEAEE